MSVTSICTLASSGQSCVSRTDRASRPRRDEAHMHETDATPACPPGCKCKLHFGFAEYMQQLTGKDYGLDRAPLAGQEHRLNVQTIGPTPPGAIPLPTEHVCADPYTCDCLTARRERKQRQEAVTLRAEQAQPWVPKPPRALRGAAA